MTEREMEDLLWDYPESFLREPLKQYQRQQSSGVSRADLVFVDSLGRLLVIEIKKGILPRDVISQIVDHYGSIKSQNPDKSVEAMVVANRNSTGAESRAGRLPHRVARDSRAALPRSRAAERLHVPIGASS